MPCRPYRANMQRHRPCSCVSSRMQTRLVPPHLTNSTSRTIYASSQHAAQQSKPLSGPFTVAPSALGVHVSKLSRAEQSRPSYDLATSYPSSHPLPCRTMPLQHVWSKRGKARASRYRTRLPCRVWIAVRGASQSSQPALPSVFGKLCSVCFEVLGGFGDGKFYFAFPVDTT
ncbi:hypothetical protein P153DRAFT_199719 [Dothidotthia symphoricarpi CBS 119687]|uniref:Uncharacterized protein n=1 Tax=Dothidotthia symphoricarpi CBS 119687 TaxID=1392245 RepID=A0A6A6AL14_9PLEO|nr:uncharacterized protein P153DRAFT_199719 [Dothidotthia symphoricarpi CBS 119687]KAF2131614.1 hypothetical protein P153DRAFT_199719 [Dothidotthia symphoricarpi CBS 119687]